RSLNTGPRPSPPRPRGSSGFHSLRNSRRPSETVGSLGAPGHSGSAPRADPSPAAIKAPDTTGTAHRVALARIMTLPAPPVRRGRATGHGRSVLWLATRSNEVPERTGARPGQPGPIARVSPPGSAALPGRTDGNDGPAKARSAARRRSRTVSPFDVSQPDSI